MTSKSVQRLRANIILNAENRAWIIEKMARRLVTHAADHGVDAVISLRPDPDADVNHWMSYAFANEARGGPTTMFITHIDDPYKLQLIKDELAGGVDIGICMSSYAVRDLVARGAPREGLCFISPALDSVVVPQRIVIGLTTRLYDDGRKREALLVRLAKSMSLAAFRFEIHGMGWEAVIPRLEDSGAEVRYYPGSDDHVEDYRIILQSIPNLDYYLYLGLDEGSLGTLDALAAGVKTIVTPQGFHVDLPSGITHAVWSYEDLELLFRSLAAERDARIASCAGWTWDAFAARHCVVWRAVVDGRLADVPRLLGQDGIETQPVGERYIAKGDFRAQALSPRRIRSALSHVPLLKPLVRFLKGV